MHKQQTNFNLLNITVDAHLVLAVKFYEYFNSDDVIIIVIVIL